MNKEADKFSKLPRNIQEKMMRDFIAKDVLIELIRSRQTPIATLSATAYEIADAFVIEQNKRENNGST